MIAQLDETHPTTQYLLSMCLKLFNKKWPAQFKASHSASLIQHMFDYTLTKFNFSFSQDNLFKIQACSFHDLYHPSVIGIN